MFNETPLHVAVRNNNTEFVKFLMSQKLIDVNRIYIFKFYDLNKILNNLFFLMKFQNKSSFNNISNRNLFNEISKIIENLCDFKF